MPELDGKEYAYNKEGMRRYKLDKEKKKKENKESKGKLTPKQKEIASKAGDPNKIEGKDFAAMKKEAKSKVKSARRHLRNKAVA